MVARSVPEAFALAVSAGPDRIAAGSGNRELSYAELDSLSDGVARALRLAGIAAGDRVIVVVERSVELVATLLGVVKCGAVYVPVDPDEPPARRAAIVRSSGAAVAVADRSKVPLEAHGLRVIPPDGVDGPPFESAPRGPGDPAYLMYTSGSTGVPKGVAVPHRAIVNLVTEANYVDLTPEDRLLQLAPAAFDASTFEIWAALLNGARLEIAPPGHLGPEAVAAIVGVRRITVLWLTAALFHRQVDFGPESLKGLHTLLAGGEALSVAHVETIRAALPDLRIVNGYGPTETTTFALCHRVNAIERFSAGVPIGRPVQRVLIEIRDDDGSPIPDGEVGELWIGGAGVALGYWEQPELTAERFVPDGAGALWYRTGDLVRRRANGVVEFHGRIDGQIKIRGHRVEPGEVESALVREETIRQAAVAQRTNAVGDPRLVAWVVLAGADFDRRSIRTHLRTVLPSYMVPAVFVVVSHLPVTRNGKIDRAALPEPDWARKEIYV